MTDAIKPCPCTCHMVDRCLACQCVRVSPSPDSERVREAITEAIAAMSAATSTVDRTLTRREQERLISARAALKEALSTSSAPEKAKCDNCRAPLEFRVVEVCHHCGDAGPQKSYRAKCLGFHCAQGGECPACDSERHAKAKEEADGR